LKNINKKANNAEKFPIIKEIENFYWRFHPFFSSCSNDGKSTTNRLANVVATSQQQKILANQGSRRNFFPDFLKHLHFNWF